MPYEVTLEMNLEELLEDLSPETELELLVGYPTGLVSEEIIARATYHEWGTRNIPMRSFIRPAYDKHIDDIVDIAQKMYSVGIFSEEEILERIGKQMCIWIQDEILEQNTVPDDPETVKRKIAQGLSPMTLIASGEMLKSVTYEIRGRGSEQE